MFSSTSTASSMMSNGERVSGAHVALIVLGVVLRLESATSWASSLDVADSVFAMVFCDRIAFEVVYGK